ncbi:MAG: rhomboid family intramembrane serine protease [Pirellulaceae bacterium]
MRRIGTLTDKSHAKRFCDYLVTQSIEATIDDGDSSWDIWIRDEADVEKARVELESFQVQPDAPKFSVSEKANDIRHQRAEVQHRKLKLQKETARKLAASNSRAMAGGALGGHVRQQNIPVTIAIIAISVACSFLTEFGEPRPSRVPGQFSTAEKVFFGLSFVDRRDYYSSGDDSFASIKKGEVWRLVSPMFLHGATMHLAFNMMGVFFLGSVIERLQGSVFFGGLVLITHMIGMFVQVLLPDAASLPTALVGLAGSPFAIGASGAVYGLFGYVWARPSLDPTFPIRMDTTNVMIMLGWLVACIFVVSGIANGAHIGGLFAGMAAAVVTVSALRYRSK